MEPNDCRPDAEARKCEVFATAFSGPPTGEYVADTDFSSLDDAASEHRGNLDLILADRANLDAAKLRDIRTDYTAICCGTTAYSPLPYRSIYEGSERLLMRDCCSEVSRQYERFGFVAASSESNEPADFLPTMLRFLASRYRSLAEDGNPSGGVYRSAAVDIARFKQDSIASWVPRYCDEALPLVSTDFYRGMLQLLGAFAIG